VAGIFATWQPEYAARGLATFPYTASNVDRRKPLVGGYTKMGLRVSRQLPMKFPDADGLALMAGARNGITVIDVDARGAEADRMLADAMTRYGQAQIVVRTGRDGRHAYYKNAGEPRKIRPDPETPIDLLGGGPEVFCSRRCWPQSRSAPIRRAGAGIALMSATISPRPSRPHRRLGAPCPETPSGTDLQTFPLTA
jgi:hypothetical protein